MAAIVEAASGTPAMAVPAAEVMEPASLQVGDAPALAPVKTKPAPEAAKKEREAPLSPTGRVFLHPSMYNVIVCSLEFRQRMDLAHFREHLRTTICRHPRFRSRVVFRERMGQPWARWVPVELDVARHVREVELSPEQLASPETAVESHMAQMVSQPGLDPSLPLWEAHILHVDRPQSLSTCVFVIHHSVGDGTSLMSLLLSACRQTANPDLLPNLPGQKRDQKVTAASKPSFPSVKSLLPLPGTKPAAVSSAESPDHKTSAPAGETTAAAGAPAGAAAAASGKAAGEEQGKAEAARGKKGGPKFKALAVVKNSMTEISKFTATATACADTKTELKAASPDHNKSKVMAVSDIILMADVMAIRKATGTTVNDVLMAAMALTVEKYLQHRVKASEQESSGKAKFNIPKRPQITAVGMVNLRKAPGLQELSVLCDGSQESGKKAKAAAPWGNKLGVVLIRLPISLQNAPAAADPPAQGQHALAMLRKMKKTCDKKKLSLEAPYSYISGRAAMSVAGTWGAAFMLKQMMANTTLTVSNMLGPMEEVSMAGVPISAISPSAPAPDHALCCHFQSYNGQLKVVLMGSTENYPDLPYMCSLFVESFQTLLNGVTDLEKAA